MRVAAATTTATSHFYFGGIGIDVQYVTAASVDGAIQHAGSESRYGAEVEVRGIDVIGAAAPGAAKVRLLRAKSGQRINDAISRQTQASRRPIATR